MRDLRSQGSRRARVHALRCSRQHAGIHCSKRSLEMRPQQTHRTTMRLASPPSG